MASRSEFQLLVIGLRELERLERTIEPAGRRFVDAVAGGIADELAAASPRGRTGRLAAGWRGRAISSNEGVIETNVAYAKARDRGLYVEAEPGRAIRFRNSFGTVIFARFVRQKGDHYVRRGLAKRRVVAELAFENTLGRLGGRGS